MNNKILTILFHGSRDPGGGGGGGGGGGDGYSGIKRIGMTVRNP